METIMIAGAGKSSTYLIRYMLLLAPRNKWKIIVADGNAHAIAEKIGGSSYAEPAVIDITNPAHREPLVKRADIVISLMPPHLHIHLAKDCLKFKKNLITSSYVSDELKEMDAAVKEAGLMFMCEMGLDPGIDHMTANKIIHSIQRVAGSITSFKSYCGGLIAPESDDNPWHYKFSWNPRNIITAGSEGAKYLTLGKEVEVPYEKIFESNKKVKIDDLGQLAYYPNRNSMQYMGLYDVPDVTTFMRATLRHPSFCKGWNAVVALGLTNQADTAGEPGVTYASWVKKAAGLNGSGTVQQLAAQKLEIGKDDKIISMLQWLGLFDETPVTEGLSSSADILQELLQRKWSMGPYDKDMVAMQHEIEYQHKTRKVKLVSSMVLIGENRDNSAMAKTVGLPMGILATLVLNKKINPPKGVLLPIMPSVYRPVLTELAHHGIVFKDEVE